MFETTKAITKTEKELFDCVYMWGRVGVVTNEQCNTFQRFMQDLQHDYYQAFCEMHEICSSCGESMADGHYNNNAECQS